MTETNDPTPADPTPAEPAAAAPDTGSVAPPPPPRPVPECSFISLWVLKYQTSEQIPSVTMVSRMQVPVLRTWPIGAAPGAAPIGQVPVSYTHLTLPTNREV